MQKVKVKDIKVKTGVTKSGQNEGKPWELIIIIGEDGSEFTTFDTGAKEVGIGGVIELNPVIKAGKTNFTEFKILEKGGAAQGPQKSTNGDMTKDDWEKKQKIERASYEAQTAFKGAIELAIADKIISLPFMDAAIAWGLKKLTTVELKEQLDRMPAVAQKPAPVPETNGEIPDFKDGVELVNYALKHGYNMSQIKENLSINKPTEIKDVAAANAILYPKAKDTTEGLFD